MKSTESGCFKSLQKWRICHRVSFGDQIQSRVGLVQGGLARDMLLGFWIDAYVKFFEGATTVIPMVHPQIDFSIFPILGKVLSHGYLATGVIHKIALPSLSG